jgi:hypothetical protein
VPSSAPLPQGTAAPNAAAPSASASGDPFAEELALLEAGRAALGSSPARALELAASHAARFPAGRLGAEREMLAIDALVRLGQRAEAQRRADRLLARSDGSLYEGRVRRLLGRR